MVGVVGRGFKSRFSADESREGECGTARVDRPYSSLTWFGYGKNDLPSLETLEETLLTPVRILSERWQTEQDDVTDGEGFSRNSNNLENANPSEILIRLTMLSDDLRNHLITSLFSLSDALTRTTATL